VVILKKGVENDRLFGPLSSKIFKFSCRRTVRMNKQVSIGEGITMTNTWIIPVCAACAIILAITCMAPVLAIDSDTSDEDSMVDLVLEPDSTPDTLDEEYNPGLPEYYLNSPEYSPHWGWGYQERSLGNSTLLWNFATGRKITSTSITPDGSYLMVGTHRDGMAILFNREGEILWSHRESTPVYEVSISADGSLIAVAADTLAVYYPHGGLYWENNTGYFAYSTAISNDGNSIAAGYDDGTVRIYDRDGNLTQIYETGGNVYGLSISSDGSYVAAGSDDGKAYLFGPGGELLWTYTAGGPVRSVSMSSDGRFIVAGSLDRMVYLFDFQGRLLWKYRTDTRVSDVSISPEGAFIAVCSGNVYLFDIEGTLLRTFESKTSGLNMIFSSTGAIFGPESTSVTLSSLAFYMAAGTGAGDHKVSLYAFPEEEIEPEERPLIDPRLQTAFAIQKTLLYGQTPGGQNIGEFAYISGLTKSYPDENVLVTIRMSVVPQWVEANGGEDAVHITQWKGDEVQEMLPTVFSGYDLQGNMVFEAESREEISSYGLISAQNPEPEPPWFTRGIQIYGLPILLAILIGAIGVSVLLMRRFNTLVPTSNEDFTKFERAIRGNSFAPPTKTIPAAPRPAPAAPKISDPEASMDKLERIKSVVTDSGDLSKIDPNTIGDTGSKEDLFTHRLKR
jgi:WD40 repeat protein